MFRINKAIAVTAAALAASVLPLAAAAPAQATPQQCIDYLENYGFEPYQTGAGCTLAADNEDIGRLMLLEAGVPDELAQNAVRLAQQSK
jgi:hypothetical protein